MSGVTRTTYADRVVTILRVSGTPASAKVIFFEEFLEKNYPFIIKK
jgi:hypothetical protein